METRREFLKALFGLAALSCDPIAAFAANAKGPKYKVGNWTGDDFTRGHQFREGKIPTFPKSPEQTYDVVIVGGGIGGLSTAFFLQDSNVLLLEQYDSLGGQARGGTFRGIDYSWGPAYVGEPRGLYADLYEQVGVKPEKLPALRNTFFWDGHWTQGFNAKEQNDLYRAFQKLIADMSGVSKILPDEDSPEAMAAPELQPLDRTRFADAVKPGSERFLHLLDSICRSALCGNAGTLSSLAGYFLMEDMRATDYCFKGGNPALARALISKLNSLGAGRLKTGTFVWRIELTSDGALINYTDKQSQPHTIACKHVVVAAPPMVAWRQIANLNDKMKIALMPFRYGSYLVANMLLDKKIFRGSYDNFVTAPFSFTDFVVAETPYEIAGQCRPDASVLTVYRPWEPGSAGRPLLLQGDKAAFAKSTVDEMSHLIGHLQEHLQEVVLTRWGHAMPVPTPGYYAQLRKILESYEGNYSLAHCSTQGLASTEAAIRAGKFAANRAKQMLSKTSWLVPSSGHFDNVLG